MDRMRNSLSLLLPIIYRPAVLHLLLPQLEQSSVVLGTIGELSCQRVALADISPPVLPQWLPRRYYTAPRHGEVLRSVQGPLFGNIIKHISPPPALAQGALLPRRYCYYTAPWSREVLASTQGRPFHNIFPHNCQRPALARALLPRHFYTSTRQSKDLNSIQRLLFRCNPRQYCTAPPGWVFDYARSSFRFWRKVMAAAAFINIMVSFVHHTYLVRVPYTSHTRFIQLETVPYTNRTHLVVRSPIDDLVYGDSCFDVIKKKHSSRFLSQLHPDSVPVNKITAELVSAVQRGLAIKSSDVALVHGSPCKDTSLGPAVESKKQGKSCRSQPQVTHLDGLNWEVIVVKNDAHVGAFTVSNGKIFVFTGLLNHLETDAEIASILAHEIAHLVARHWSEGIIYKKWFPYPLKDGDRGRSHRNDGTGCCWFRSTHSPCGH
uniref:Uncharacterized protein n=1 Tax=Avena sativa TaxID=4498 RepID=A0ACD5Y1N5_AVESA